jgi:hypothetical protein
VELHKKRTKEREGNEGIKATYITSTASQISPKIFQTVFSGKGLLLMARVSVISNILPPEQ